MRKRPGLLSEIESTNTDAWVRSLGNPTDAEFDKAADQYLNPGRDIILQMDDDDLAELAGRNPRGKLGELAASEMRRREAWRTPARWSLIVSAVALLLSVLAFIRTL